MNKFLGELTFDIEGHQLPVRLDMNALRLWAEKEGTEFNEVATKLQSGDFNQIVEFLWHGHRNACHRVGGIPQLDRNQFLAFVCGNDPDELAEMVANALSLGEDDGGVTT